MWDNDHGWLSSAFNIILHREGLKQPNLFNVRKFKMTIRIKRELHQKINLQQQLISKRKYMGVNYSRFKELKFLMI